MDAKMNEYEPQYKSLFNQTLILLLFWLLFFIMLFGVFAYFVYERNHVNQTTMFNNHNANFWISQYNSGSYDDKLTASQWLVQLQYPLIDFSLLSFSNLFKIDNSQVSTIDYWSARQTSINTAYSYIFITLLITLIGVIFYCILLSRIMYINKINRKLHMYNSDYDQIRIIKYKMYLKFTVNLAVMFAFFNFMSTLIVLAYGLVLLLITKIFPTHSSLLIPDKWWKTSAFKLLVYVFVYQNIYNLARSLFIQYFSVDIDLIVQIIFPIGTTAVIIALFVKNMFSSNITAINNKLNTIISYTDKLVVFYKLKGNEALNDFNFVSNLPVVFSKSIVNLSNEKQTKIFNKIFDILDEIKILKIKNNDKQCLHYYFFNNVNDIEQMESLFEFVKNLNIYTLQLK